MIIRRRFRIGKVTSPTGSLPGMKGNSVRVVFRGSSGTPFPTEGSNSRSSESAGKAEYHGSQR
jgi:hypothetical protein